MISYVITLEDQLETIAQTKGYTILEARVVPDHIHLFIESNPFDSPTNIVKIFKQVSRIETGVMAWGVMVTLILYWYCWTCLC